MWLNIDTKQKVCKYSILRLSYEIFSFWIFFLFLGIWLLSVWLAGWHFSIFTFVCVCDSIAIHSICAYCHPTNIRTPSTIMCVCGVYVYVHVTWMSMCVCVVVCDPVHAQYLIKSYIQIEFESVMMKWYVYGCRSVLCVVCSVCFNGLSTSYQIPENRTNWYWSRRVETSYRLKWLLNE